MIIWYCDPIWIILSYTILYYTILYYTVLYYPIASRIPPARSIWQCQITCCASYKRRSKERNKEMPRTQYKRECNYQICFTKTDETPDIYFEKQTKRYKCCSPKNMVRTKKWELAQPSQPSQTECTRFVLERHTKCPTLCCFKKPKVEQKIVKQNNEDKLMLSWDAWC